MAGQANEQNIAGRKLAPKYIRSGQAMKAPTQLPNKYALLDIEDSHLPKHIKRRTNG
jgi:hypothetical protein